MFEQFIKRENDIFDILQVFIDNNLDFILVGGYAISAFKHRFSVDVDIVISSKDLKKFEDVLIQNKFTKIISKELENIYSSKFIRYQKKKELAVSVDLLVGGMGIRQTNSIISFDKLNKNCINKKIKGIEKEIIAKIPVKELLIAIKLQSGRLTDFRDVVALCKYIDINKVKEYLKNADKKILNKHTRYLLALLNKKGFIDSFKGVFIEKKFDVDINEVRKLRKLLS